MCRQAGGCGKAGNVELFGQHGGDFVKCGVHDRAVIGERRGRAQALQDRGARRALCEQAMDIAAGDPAVRGYSTLRAGCRVQEGARRVRPLGAADMDLVAFEQGVSRRRDGRWWR